MTISKPGPNKVSHAFNTIKLSPCQFVKVRMFYQLRNVTFHVFDLFVGHASRLVYVSAVFLEGISTFDDYLPFHQCIYRLLSTINTHYLSCT